MTAFRMKTETAPTAGVARDPRQVQGAIQVDLVGPGPGSARPSVVESAARWTTASETGEGPAGIRSRTSLANHPEVLRRGTH